MNVNWLSLVHCEETDSTNNQVKNFDSGKEMTVLTTQYQKAGRGQRGNSWESEKSQNLLFSILIHPNYVTASHQFCLSQAISLAIAQTLAEYTPGISIKWPNDIYWNNRKICGILIENDLMGKFIQNCIIGIGLNVNQQKFLSDAPNPISLYQILGHETPCEEVLAKILTRFHQMLNQIKEGNTADIIQAYHNHLYRRTGLHPYKDEKGTFMAHIIGVEPQGFLVLCDEQGTERRYAFKEVSYIINLG